MSITVVEGLVFLFYLGGNVAVLYFGRAALSQTAAMLALINAAPLFLKGRPNYFVDLVGIPLSTHASFHHFFGRVAIAEGTMHAALELRSQRNRSNLSGYLVCSVFLFLPTTHIDADN